jgi:hypothetical protein
MAKGEVQGTKALTWASADPDNPEGSGWSFSSSRANVAATASEPS